MSKEQLSFLDDVDEKAVRKIVIKELKNYRALKVQLENKKNVHLLALTFSLPSGIHFPLTSSRSSRWNGL